MRHLHDPLPHHVGQRAAVDEDAAELVDSAVACGQILSERVTGDIVSKLSGVGRNSALTLAAVVRYLYLSNLIHMETFKLLLILFSEFVEISFHMLM